MQINDLRDFGHLFSKNKLYLEFSQFSTKPLILIIIACAKASALDV